MSVGMLDSVGHGFPTPKPRINTGEIGVFGPDVGIYSSSANSAPGARKRGIAKNSYKLPKSPKSPDKHWTFRVGQTGPTSSYIPTQQRGLHG